MQWAISSILLSRSKQSYFLIGLISILIIWFCCNTYYYSKEYGGFWISFSYFPSLFNFCSIHLIVFYFLCSLLRVENKQIQRVIRNYVVNDILNSQWDTEKLIAKWIPLFISKQKFPYCFLPIVKSSEARLPKPFLSPPRDLCSKKAPVENLKSA